MARACSAAAKELAAARAYIEGQKAEIAAADDRIAIAVLQIETLKRIGALSSERAVELEKVIAAERAAKTVALERIEIQERRIATLEKRLGRARKFTLILGVAAAVGVLIAIGK